MNPGKFNKRVTIQTLTESVGSYGAVTETYADSFKRWAKVRPVRGREPYVNDQRLPELDLVVELRYDTKTKAITPKHRLQYGARILEIDSVINVEENSEEIRLFCKEFV